MEVKYIKIRKEEETRFCLDQAQPTFYWDMTVRQQMKTFGG